MARSASHPFQHRARTRTSSRAPGDSWVDRIAGRFLRRRPPVGGDVRLTQRNVYVLPSRAGMLYATILLAMLIASVNYALSLGFMLTFLLGAIAVVAMLHTFRNMVALVLRPGRADPVFAGQPAQFSLLLINPARHDRHALNLFATGMVRPEVVDVSAQTEQLVTIALPAPQRGWMSVPRLKLWSEFPLGLWRVWSYWHPSLRVLVYPTPETPPAPLPESRALAGDGEGGGGGEDDIAAVRPWQPGDSPRRIAWKAMARTASDTLLTKQFEGGERGELWFDWHHLPATLDPELRISRLTRWVLDADASGARWALTLPGEPIPLDGGPGHRDRCLEALATMRV
ncbi:MAG TPA: DUF58 domain-containing protein [Quisquiliibacterium sp.]|nr:DUF58 domain-containing protein [Quisquiliibacterium sp.]HQN10749.1 DUF58 domain-containing protein [Quisquiliibacterium sp.]HQP66909.1 DUF58 domain-containing protein [Quisquiliibacterium sp.]